MRRGYEGEGVRAWQEFLTAGGHLEPGASGLFDLATETATRSFQALERLGADGIVGPRTLAAARAHGFVEVYPLDPLVAKTASALGIPVELMESFRLVESGTRSNPRAVRFEPHLAYRKIGDRARTIPYTPQSERKRWSMVFAETNRAAFDRALGMHSDEEWRRAIIESASFGLFQVLGSGLIDLFGVDEAVPAFDQDPEVVSYALVSGWFRKNPSALAAAQADPPDIRTLVKRYNGNGPNVDNYVHKFTDALLRVRGLG